MAPGCDDITNFCVGTGGNPAICVDKGPQNLCERCGSLDEPACVGEYHCDRNGRMTARGRTC